MSLAADADAFRPLTGLWTFLRRLLAADSVYCCVVTTYIHTYIHRVYLPTVPVQMAKPSGLPRGRAIEKIIFLNMIF